MADEQPSPANNALLGVIIVIALAAGYMYYMAQQELNQIAAVLNVQTTDVLTMLQAANDMAAKSATADNLKKTSDEQDKNITKLNDDLKKANADLSKSQADLQIYKGKSDTLDKQLKDTIAAITTVNDFILTTYIGTDTQQQKDFITNLSAVRNVASDILTGQLKVKCSKLDDTVSSTQFGTNIPSNVNSARKFLVYVAQQLGTLTNNQICDPGMTLQLLNNVLTVVLPTIQQCTQLAVTHGALYLSNSQAVLNGVDTTWGGSTMRKDAGGPTLSLAAGPGNIVVANPSGKEWVLQNLDTDETFGTGMGFQQGWADNTGEVVGFGQGYPMKLTQTCITKLDTKSDQYKTYAGIQTNIATLINMVLSTVCQDGRYDSNAGAALVTNLISLVCNDDNKPVSVWFNKIIDNTIGLIAKSLDFTKMATQQTVSVIVAKNISDLEKINS